MDVLVLTPPAFVVACVTVFVLVARRPAESRIPFLRNAAVRLAIGLVATLGPAMVGDYFQQRTRPSVHNEVLQTSVTVTTLLALVAFLSLVAVLGAYAVVATTRVVGQAVTPRASGPRAR